MSRGNFYPAATRCLTGPSGKDFRPLPNPLKPWKSQRITTEIPCLNLSLKIDQGIQKNERKGRTGRVPSSVGTRQRSGEGVVQRNGCPKECFWRVRFFSAPLRFSGPFRRFKGKPQGGREETDSPKPPFWTTVSPHDAFAAPLAHSERTKEIPCLKLTKEEVKRTQGKEGQGGHRHLVRGEEGRGSRLLRDRKST